MNQDKSLKKIEKENIFTKILAFIRNLFNKSSNSSNNNSQNNFSENVHVIHSDISELLELQKKYESNQIGLSDLSQDQLYELNILYQRQITKLKKQIEEAQTEIKIVQYGLKNKNADA